MLHQPVRMQIMATLVALPRQASLSFVALREMLALTDGNLSAHLRKLEESGYVRVDRRFAGRRPLTQIAATERGRTAFTTYVRTLLKLIEQAGETAPRF